MNIPEITADNVKLFALHNGRIAMKISLPDGRVVGIMLQPIEAIALAHALQAIGEQGLT